MDTLRDLLLGLAVAVLGVYAGAMLTEGFVLVPYWRSLAPVDFLAWYAANDRRLLDFFSPVTSLAALVPLAAAALSLWTRHPGRWASLAAAVVVLAAVATFFVYFEAANAGFSAAAFAHDELPGELARWEAWHHARTVLALAALGLALVAARPRRA